MKGKTIIARRKGYVLYGNGELWTTGKHAYMCGSVMDARNIDTAILNAEEEMSSLMLEGHRT